MNFLGKKMKVKDFNFGAKNKLYWILCDLI